MSFLDEIGRHDPQQVLAAIESKTAADVERVLLIERLRPDDFMTLLSPAAEGYIEAMAQKAHRTTQQRFGRTILLYAPIYLSNECSNGCVYCGFNATNRVPRKTLTLEEIEREAQVLHELGYRHILLVTGEFPAKVDNEFIAAAARRIRHLFSSISIEVYPMEEDGYRQMVEAGIDGLTIYQETYDRELYAELHPFGKKRNYDFRLLT
ncbi:radical SAM protein, partial [Desulfuromonas sp. TF]|uniref:radical SAM protein n=1 Tax=Desulfuromonas sp. TF TaxID=1232410 RepID=UPI001D04ACC6